MKLRLCLLTFILSAVFSVVSIAGPQYRSYPVSISKKKYKAIQARRYKKREVAVVPRQFRDPSKFSMMFTPQTSKVRYVNNNQINRKRNQKAVAVRRRNERNYSDYRDAVANTERSNFSIYDK